MKSYYKRHLPHYTPDGYALFITSRLANSLPQEIIEKLKIKKEKNYKLIAGIKNQKIKKEKYSESKSQYFELFDDALEKFSNGPYWLSQSNIAKIILDSIHFRNSKVYHLFAFTIMPNHIHVIFKPIVGQFGKLSYKTKNEKYILGNIMGSFKRHTAKECNIILKRTGQFWQHENYDHVIRNHQELINTVSYIINNPVKAGLVDNSENWEWNYYNPKLIAG